MTVWRNDAVKLGEIIRRLRLDRAWNQRLLAAEAQISQQAVSKIERGLVDEPKSIVRIAKAFGMTVDELLTRCGTPGQEHPAGQLTANKDFETMCRSAFHTNDLRSSVKPTSSV